VQVAVSRSKGELDNIKPLAGSFATLEYVQGDATDPQVVSSAVSRAVQDFGGIDALSHSEGGGASW
jgi:NAD(P)-dependent dehydrogenase (short-subunit alcohol dehydrogenase family)